ncbi:MAG: hypothetical protein KBC50_02035 [Candidatus Pacebacteria bacterium]|jgi:hypothetical protein|nr:hypothetical protein [Candidatus Paceibacterota bacterium]
MGYIIIALVVAFLVIIEIEFRFQLRQQYVHFLWVAADKFLTVLLAGWYEVLVPLWLYLRRKAIEFWNMLAAFRKKFAKLLIGLLWLVLLIAGIALLMLAGTATVFSVAGTLLLIGSILTTLSFSNIWAAVAAFIVTVVAVVAFIWEALWDGLAVFLKSLAMLLASVSIMIPSCSFPEKSAEAPVVTPIEQRVVVGQPITPRMRVINKLIADKGEGCLKVSKRGGLPLTLLECKSLTEYVGRKVEVRGKWVLAPNLTIGEEWYLVQEGAKMWWIINPSNR